MSNAGEKTLTCTVRELANWAADCREFMRNERERVIESLSAMRFAAPPGHIVLAPRPE